MAAFDQILNTIKTGGADPLFQRLYGNKPGALKKQVERYTRAIEAFRYLYPGQTEIELFSSPGRTEVGGNHTDHNAGHILAAAVDLDILAVVAKNDANAIRIKSEGYSQDVVALDQLSPIETERLTSPALARGVCSRLKALGYAIGGFDAYVTSIVPKGAGLSSSAAFEVLVAEIENDLYNDGRLDPVLLAQIAQYAENNFFGKPCGLMDMTTCAVGGFVTIDFKDFDHPIVQKVNFDFSASGYSMVIVDTGGNHADLNDDYTALEHEMKAVAHAFGGEVLREFSKEKVLSNIAYLRTKVNDRAILRAIHFYDDDQRVLDQVRSLEQRKFDHFMSLIIESGYSSWMLCQNCMLNHHFEEQGVAIGLMVSENLLKGRGAWRVHGGGFAGTIQAFVPNEFLEDYMGELNSIFGAGACHELVIRPSGTERLDIL